MESADLSAVDSGPAAISERLMEELEAEGGEADDPLPPLPDLMIGRQRSPAASGLANSAHKGAATVSPPDKDLLLTEEEQRVRNRYRKMALYASLQDSSSSDEEGASLEKVAVKDSGLGEKEKSGEVERGSHASPPREEGDVSHNQECDKFSDEEDERFELNQKKSRPSKLQLSSDEDGDQEFIIQQKHRRSSTLQSSDEENDAARPSKLSSSSSSDEESAALNSSRKLLVRPSSSSSSAEEELNLSQRRKIRSSSSSSSSSSSEAEGVTSVPPAADNELFDTEADLPVEASSAAGRRFLFGNSDGSSDSTSSDDEPPPLTGRWTHSGGAAKKQSASRPRPRDGSDEEAPAEARNQQRKAKENLLAIHSESQRLVREADCRLPYHEPKRFSKFSEFKAMLEAERNSEGQLKKKATASKTPPNHRPGPKLPSPVGSPLPPDATSTQVPPPEIASSKALLPEAAYTESAVPDIFAPRVPSPYDEDFEEVPSPLPDVGKLDAAPCPPGMEFPTLPKDSEEEERKKDAEIASESDLFSSKPSSPGPGMYSTPCNKMASVDPLRNLPLMATRIDFDADSVDLDARSVTEENADVAAEKAVLAPAPLASRLAVRNRLPATLLASLRGVTLEPQLARPDPDGFVDLELLGGTPPSKLDTSTDSTRSLHPMLRRLRRHQKPSERRSAAAANKSVQIVTKVKDGEEERLRLEEVRLMPPPPVPPVGATASARAATWRAHRQLLQEQMRQKRLQGLAERQRQWALYNNEEGGSGGGAKQRSADDMDSDDEEYAPADSGDSEEDSEAEEGDDEEEEEEDEEEEEEEERASARRQRQSFLDVEAEEADEAEEETFEDAVGGGQDDLTLHLLEDDDEAILRAPAMEGEEEEDERMAISSRRSDSRKLSLNSRDLFASDADEISSVRSSASSVFQPGQRSFVMPDDLPLYGGSSRQTSDCEGRSSLEPSVDENSTERSKTLHDEFMEEEPRQLSSQDALRLFSGGITATSDAIDAAAADLFMMQTQTEPHAADLFMMQTQTEPHATDGHPPLTSLSQDFLSSEDEEDFLKKRPTQRLLSSDDDESVKGVEMEEEKEDSAEEEDEDGGASINDEDEDDHEELDGIDEDGEEGEEFEEDEEDDERAVFQRLEHLQKASKKPRANVAQFLEEEAELSGSGDDVSSDENEEGLGGDLEDSDWIEKNPRAAGDAVQLQRDLERVHARLERDEDQRAVRFLQELYLPDGDLTTGESAARRRFRWRGVEADGEEGGDAPQLESDESDGDQEFSFVEDRRPALGGDAKLNTSVASTDSTAEAAKEGEEESQLFRIGLSALQNIPPRQDVQPDSAPVLPSKPHGLVKRGSFLSKASSDLGRIGDLMRQSDQGAPRKTGMVCFSREDALRSKFLKPIIPQPSKPAKRPSNDGDNSANKRSRMSGQPLRPVNSIFCSMEK